MSENSLINKRLRYTLAMRKRAVIHQNFQVVAPPPGYDDEGRLPESLPPTPVVDLITEDEEEPERHTPVKRLKSLEGLDNQAIEADAATSSFVTPMPPALRPLKTSSGKSLAVLASIREPCDSPSSNSSSPVPAASPSQSSQADDEAEGDVEPNVTLLLEEERHRLQMIESERHRLEIGKRRLMELVPGLERKRDAANEAVAAMKKEVEVLNRRIREQEAAAEQYQFEVAGIKNFCG